MFNFNSNCNLINLVLYDRKFFDYRTFKEGIKFPIDLEKQRNEIVRRA